MTVDSDLLQHEFRFAYSTPFGSHDYITRRLLFAYLGMLEIVRDGHRQARDMVRHLGDIPPGVQRAVIADSLLRRTIEDGVCSKIPGIAAIEPDIIAELLDQAMSTTDPSPPLVGPHCSRIDAAPDVTLRAWTDLAPTRRAGRRFIAELSERLPAFAIVAPTAEQIQCLISGTHLILSVVPELARSCLPHICVIVIVEFENAPARFEALTMPGLPGVLIVSPTALTDAASAAETLLHESLHLKFLDTEYIHPLFRVGYRSGSSPRITPPWHADNPNEGNWPIDRALTASHVYAGLRVMLESASQQGRECFGKSSSCADRASTCVERGRWLLEEVRLHPELLAEDGLRFVSWIESSLAS